MNKTIYTNTKNLIINFLLRYFVQMYKMKIDIFHVWDLKILQLHKTKMTKDKIFKDLPMLFKDFKLNQQCLYMYFKF